MNSPYQNDLLNQPQALQDTLNGLMALPSMDVYARKLAEGTYQRILLTGMGSSFHAFFPLRYRLIQHGIPVEHIETSELIHYAPALIQPRSLMLVMSQSGKSVEVVRLLEMAGAEVDIIAITNTADSPLARAARYTVLTQAGEEFTVSCKTYVAGLAALTWLGDQLMPESAPMVGSLSETPHLVRTYLENWQTHVANLIQVMSGARNMFLVGRGDSLAAVGTGGLIIKEASHFPTEGMSAAAFRHGPFESVAEGVFVLVFLGDPRTARLHRALAQDIMAVGGSAGLVQESTGKGVFDLPACPPAARPILEILPVEMFTLALAELKGHIAGQFSRGGKVTVVE